MQSFKKGEKITMRKLLNEYIWLHFIHFFFLPLCLVLFSFCCCCCCFGGGGFFFGFFFFFFGKGGFKMTAVMMKKKISNTLYIFPVK